jgi:membrane protein implicated in regulation of membrane protease activity
VIAFATVMTWWIWILAGFGMLLLELMTPGGFYFLFFGAAAIVAGVMAAAGVGPDWVLWLVFSVLSVVSLLVFRGPLLRRLKRDESSLHAVDSLVGQSVVITEDAPAGGMGKAELRGTVWNVQNAGSELVGPGQRCRVLRVDGLKLVVQAAD